MKTEPADVRKTRPAPSVAKISPRGLRWGGCVLLAAVVAASLASHAPAQPSDPDSQRTLEVTRALNLYRQIEAAHTALETPLGARLAPGLERQAERLGEAVLGAIVLRAKAVVLQGEPDRAISLLQIAAKRGYHDAAFVRTDPILGRLASHKSWPGVMDAMRAATKPRSSSPPDADRLTFDRNGVGTLAPRHFGFDGSTGMLVVWLEPDKRDADQKTSNPVRNLSEQASEKLNRWVKQGKAAGHVGDLYENRDGGHSGLKRNRFPTLRRTAYNAELQAWRPTPNWGVQRFTIYNRPTIGNSSTAIRGGFFRRSNPRSALTLLRASESLALQYRSNQLYLYPEHTDHEPGEKDRFPANTPYMIISQGSSGSDQPFLTAILASLAAFKPEVKRQLIEAGAIAPTLQYVMRRSLRGVESREDYLKPFVHPSVYGRASLRPEAMIDLAQSLTPEDLPPMVELRVVEETLGQPGIDYLLPTPSEQLLTTPQAIGRIAQSLQRTRRMVVSAESSWDLNDRPLRFRWELLRGDPNKVRIKPRDDGATAEIEIDWQTPNQAPLSPEPGGPTVRSDRVDIAVFADNGARYSAPAFISVVHPRQQSREYAPDGRLLKVLYRGPYDRALNPARRWEDVYAYDDAGQLLGWVRTDKPHRRSGKKAGPPRRYTAEGARVLETDELGRPLRARTVQYRRKSVRRQDMDQHMAGIPLEEHPGQELLFYAYDGPDDMRGRVVRRERATTQSWDPQANADREAKGAAPNAP